jgi:hypothetical protein
MWLYVRIWQGVPLQRTGEQHGKGGPMIPTSANQEDGAVAIALQDVIVRGEHNALAETATPGIAGARAALETFYYAFNTHSLSLYQQIWADDTLVQLSSPVAGMVRGSATIAALAARIFAGPAQVQTVVEDIVAYATPELVVFAARERAAYTREGAPDGEREALSEIHSICVFRFIAAQGGWRLVYHSVWLDDTDQIARYQRAVRGA